ncbi:SH3 domain-containing protein [Solidesulfovibrio sp.]
MSRSCTAFLLFAALMAASSCPAFCSDADVYRAEVRDDGNNLREFGGAGYKKARILGVLNTGDQVTVLKQEGRWSEVVTAGGLRGYVHSVCLRLLHETSGPSDAARQDICPPEYPRKFSADLDGDGVSERILLEDIPSPEGGDARLAVVDAKGATIWRGPAKDSPLVFSCRDWGIYWPGAVGDLFGDGQAWILAREPQSDVSVSSFALGRWTGDGFAPESRGWSLVESPANPGSFKRVKYAADDNAVTWIMNVEGLASGGEARVSVYRTSGDGLQTGVALARLTPDGARIVRWIESMR